MFLYETELDLLLFESLLMEWGFERDLEIVFLLLASSFIENMFGDSTESSCLKEAWWWTLGTIFLYRLFLEPLLDLPDLVLLLFDFTLNLLPCLDR